MTTTADPVTLFLDAVARGSGIPTDIYASGAVLDATVPNWRLEAHGPSAISRQLSGSYAHPGRLHDIARSPLPGGAMVRFDARTRRQTAFAHSRRTNFCTLPVDVMGRSRNTT